MNNFNSVPTIHAPRAKFDLNHTRKQSMNVGTIYPFDVQEIYPGDSFKVNTTCVTRISSSLIRPIMDDLYQDIYYFFVPSRLVYEKWQEIFGENTQSAWAQVAPVHAPYMYKDGVDETNEIPICIGTVGDYLGLPAGVPAADGFLPSGCSILPFRAFALIYNEWFRDENIIAPMQIEKGVWKSSVELPNSSDWSSANYVGGLPKAAKLHDPFTSTLPGPQKGSAIPIPLTLQGQFLPLYADELTLLPSAKQNVPIMQLENPSTVDDYAAMYIQNVTSGTTVRGTISHGATGTSGALPNYKLQATNLGVELPSSTNVTVNDLRYAFQLQKILERASRSGSRYTEYLLSAFGVQAPDARLQRPEYLGGKRFPLSIQQVAQTTRPENDDLSLGSLGAFSLSSGRAGYVKSFCEHGYCIGITVIRQKHTYQSSIEPFWMRHDRFDFYDPILSTIGEQPVFRTSLFGFVADSSSDVKANAFGYQEAWWDLRSRLSSIAGQMRSTAGSDSLDIWHLGDDYANAPTLNKQWLEETPDNLDRCLAVPSSSMDQFICDIYMNVDAVRRLPVYSVPSLIDHH